MSVSAELVRQEVASLHRFIEPIVRMCSDLRQDYPVYSPPTREFFRHIQTLGDQTLKFLEEFPKEVFKDPRTTSSKRQKLESLKAAWEDLHEYIRPALDADSLRLPTPLITALHDRLHEVEEWKEYRFTVFLTVEANYFEIPASGARDTANKIADLIGGTEFPPSLGLIGIPYSQGDGCFLNCILAHEMGHFVYEEDAVGEIEDYIDTALQNMADEVGGLDEEDMSLCNDLLTTWVEEVFCDLFAVYLIGPAFSFSLLQLVGASFLIDRRDGEPADFYSFMKTHPAEVFRIQMHQKLLDRFGWWAVIKNWQSGAVEVLNKCSRGSALYTVECRLPDEVSPDKLLACYEEICEHLIEYFLKFASGTAKQVKAFSEQCATISEYLRRAVVPSTIILKKEEITPSPLVLLNAGFQFLLEDFTLLLNNIEGARPDSIEGRSRLIRRLELWLLKALEDSRLLTGQKE